jgi:uncharacterized membrane protein YbhN (UPF0104 family)
VNDSVTSASAAGERTGPVPAWPRRWRRLLFLAVAAVVAAVVLPGKLPNPGHVVSAMRSADPRWLVAGLLAEWVSMAAFARQQLWLLRGLGVSTTIGKALAVTYARSAISISLPAGAAVSAGFAYKTFRQWGASPEVAATVMVLSGILSSAGLGLLYLFGFLAILATSPRHSWHTHPVAIVTTLAIVLAYGLLAGWIVHRRHLSDPVAAQWTHPASAPRTEPSGSPASRWAGMAGGWPAIARSWRAVARGWRATARSWLATGRRAVAVALAMPGRHRRVALAFAVLNWLTDLCCLAAVAYAFHLPVTFAELAAVYLAVQLVRQVPVTPGGMGVIEVSLLAALVTAGAGQAPAAATVLGYRLFSCWLIIPAGLLAWAFLRDRRPTVPQADR